MSRKRNKSNYRMRKATEPTTVDGLRATLTEYYKDILYNKVKGRLELKCPDEWNTDWFLNNIIRRGYMLISDSAIGVNPFECSLYGINYMSLPINARVAMPIIGTFTKKLDKDAVLVYFERKAQNTFFTFNAIVTHYAVKLAMLDITFDVNCLNTGLGHLIEVETDAQKATIELAYDNLTAGRPLTIVRKDSLAGIGTNAVFNNVGNTFIGEKLIDARRSIINDFLTQIGVNNANTDKKERVITQEVNANNEEIELNLEVFTENLEKQNDAVKSMFGIDYSLKFREFDSRTNEVMPNDINRPGGSMVTGNGTDNK